jgi:hypothetical protein
MCRRRWSGGGRPALLNAKSATHATTGSETSIPAFLPAQTRTESAAWGTRSGQRGAGVSHARRRAAPYLRQWPFWWRRGGGGRAGGRPRCRRRRRSPCPCSRRTEMRWASNEQSGRSGIGVREWEDQPHKGGPGHGPILLCWASFEKIWPTHRKKEKKKGKSYRRTRRLSPLCTSFFLVVEFVSELTAVAEAKDDASGVMWQNHLRNEGSVFQDPNWVILDEAKMHVNTHTKHLKS